jgi:beta-1,4-mannosyltransferase
VSPNIELDLRPEPLTDAELEAAVDGAHAVVLPYRRILNSGAALYAMSRNRMLLAPRQGSLPELQTAVGGQWVHLYDGDLTVAVLRTFVAAVRGGTDLATPDLSAFEWGSIAEKIRGLLRTLLAGDADRGAHR